MWLFGKGKESNPRKSKIPAIEEKTFEPISSFGNFSAAYAYKDVEVAGVDFAAPDLNLIRAGDNISFQLEPDNPNDKNAVKIICKDQPIGYVHKCKLQGMIKDWQIRKDLMLASISKIDRNEKSIKYGIAFYKDKLEGKENWDSINASLTKTSKKDYSDMSRQEYYDAVNEGDVLQAEYDEYEEDYTISDDIGNELGELSKSVSTKVHTKEVAGFEIIPVIDEITESDSGKYGANIIVYFKPRR